MVKIHLTGQPDPPLPERGAKHLERLPKVLAVGESLASRLEAGTVIAPTEKARPLQIEGLERLRDYCRRAPSETPEADGLLKTHYAVATGIGKTGLFCMIANAAQVPTVAFVPFKELVRQTRRDAERFTPDLKVGVFYGDEHDIPENPGLIVVTYDSAKNFIDSLPPGMEFPVVVYDEAHLGMTEHRLGLAPRVPGASLVVACTGSPDVNEKKQVRMHFGEPLLEVSTPDGIRMSQLASAYAVILKTNVPVGETRVKADGDRELTADAERKLVQVEARNQGVISILKSDQVRGRGTIVTCINTHHADELARRAEAEGLGPVGILHYKSDADEAQLLADCRAGKIKTLFVVRKTVGIDLPNFEVLVNARPSWSIPDAVQRTGRVARLCNDIPDKVSLIIDLLDDYDLAEVPVTGIAVLENNIVLPEGAESDPRTSARIADIQGMAASLELPDGWELVLTQDRSLELLSGAEAPVARNPLQEIHTLDDVRTLFSTLGITSAADFYQKGVDTVLKSRVECDEPQFSGSMRSLIGSTVQRLCKRPDIAFRAGAYRVLLDALYGDEAWEAARAKAKDLEGGNAIPKLIDKLASVPPTGCSTRVRIEGIVRAPEFEGWEQLRFLGISRDEVERIDYSAVIPESTLQRLLDRWHPKLERDQEGLLHDRQQSALVHDLRRIGTLDDILTGTSTRIERITRAKFREEQYLDPESGRAFSGRDVERALNITCPGEYDRLIEDLIDQPERIAVGRAFRYLEEDRSNKPLRTLSALRILAADGELIERLRELDIRPGMHRGELQRRFLRDPVNEPIPLLQVMQLLAGPDGVEDIGQQLELLCGDVSAGNTGALLNRLNSWPTEVANFERARLRLERQMNVPQTSTRSPTAALQHLMKATRGGSGQSYSPFEAIADVEICTRWQKQLGTSLSAADQKRLQLVAEDILRWGTGVYSPEWWRVGQGIGELLGRELKTTTAKVAHFQCRIEEQPLARATYDVLLTPTGHSGVTNELRISVLSAGDGRPWCVVHPGRWLETESRALLDGAIAPQLVQAVFKAHTGQADVRAPVVLTINETPTLAEGIRQALGGATIPISARNSPVATPESRARGEFPIEFPSDVPVDIRQAVQRAIEGAEIQTQLTGLVAQIQAGEIPAALKQLVVKEFSRANACEASVRSGYEALRTALQDGSAIGIMRAVASASVYGSSQRPIAVVLSEFDRVMAEQPREIAAEDASALAELVVRGSSMREADIRAAVQSMFGKPAASALPASTEAAIESAPGQLPVTLREKLPTLGYLFNPSGKMVAFQASTGAGPVLHSNPACRNIAQGTPLEVQAAAKALASATKPNCCRGCFPFKNAGQLTKVEGQWAKVIPQRVVEEGPWNR